jgi:hypothetical protein
MKGRSFAMAGTRWIAIALFLCAASAQAGEPGLLLSWGRPQGMAGATDSVVVLSADTSRADTLYLTFQVNRPTPAVQSMNAFVYFRPVAGDTLGDFWSLKSGQANAGGLEVDFAPIKDLPGQSPWLEHGEYTVSYDRAGDARRLSFDNRVIEPSESVGLDPGVRYCFARVRISHRRPHLSGHSQPVCIEWGAARIQFTTGRELVLRGSESGVVRWNSTRSCAPQPSLSRPWVPKTR